MKRSTHISGDKVTFYYVDLELHMFPFRSAPLVSSLRVSISHRRIVKFPVQIQFSRYIMSTSQHQQRYKLVFFAPPINLAELKEAIFATGAGSYPGQGSYTKCAFTTPGVGQFLPGAEAKPAIGEPGKVEEVGEARCEILCVGESVAKDAVEALKK